MRPSYLFVNEKYREVSMLKKLRFRYKVLFIPALAIFALIITTVINQFYTSANEQLLLNAGRKYLEALDANYTLERMLSGVQYQLQAAVAAGKPAALNQADSLAQIYLQELSRMQNSPVMPAERFQQLKSDFQKYFQSGRKTALLLIRGKTGPEVVKAMAEVRSNFQKIKDLLSTNSQNFSEQMEVVLTGSQANFKSNRRLVILAVIFITVIITMLALFLSKRLSRSLYSVMGVINRLSVGDASVLPQVTSQDEFGMMAESVKKLVGNYKELVNAAEEIGQGNYEVSVKIRSEADELGRALNQMKNNLKKISLENERQHWFKNGQNELHKRIQGEQNLAGFAGKVLSYLAEFLNTPIGVFYIKSDKNELRLLASHAFKIRRAGYERVKLGEGLVGQAALEQKSFLVTDLPNDYLTISSGLGQKQPDSLAVLPLVHEGETLGVIEIGSFGLPREIQLKFLEEISGTIAIYLRSILARQKLEELLEETQRQAEELQVQQEELRQTNEKLEAQTRALQASERKLQAQQEELHQTNQELTRQARELEQQKEEVEKKNRELRRAQKLIEEKAQALEEANQYKSSFLANMSHELRTPLNSMLLLSKLLMDNAEGNLTAKQLEFAQTIYKSGNELLSLINDILDLSKVEAGKLEVIPEKVFVNDLVRALENQFGPLAKKKGLSFTTEISPDSPTQLFSDPVRIQQILKNLLSNAIKFTEKGEVKLKVTKASKNRVAFTVSDTGIGIPKEKQESIFETFKQVDSTISRNYGGTGLGLSICRELSRLLQGEILLQSEPGKGSTFTLILPASLTRMEDADESRSQKTELPKIQTETVLDNPPPAKPATIARDDRENLTSQDKSILIIEDDSAFAQTLGHLVREKGFKCIIAEDGNTGLEMAARYLPCGILLDLGLPGKSGWEVLEQLKDDRRTRHIPVHIISGDENARDGLKLGAIGALQKPAEPQAIQRALEKIETMAEKPVKKLLFFSTNSANKEKVLETIGNGDVETVTVSDEKEALRQLQQQQIDCLLLEFCENQKGFIEHLKAEKETGRFPIPPVIIFSSKPLPPSDEKQILQVADRVIQQDDKVLERILDETTLFLHRIEANLPPEKQRIIRILHNREEIFQNKTVLIVDDDMRNVFALTGVLESKGMKVLIGKNGEEGVEMVRQHPEIDIVLMDIMMPVLDGYEAMRQIRQSFPQSRLPIIALTAKAMKGDREKCLAAGASDYLSKPVDVDRLLSLMRVWLHR